MELLRHWRKASAVIREPDPFWCFEAWADFAESLGARSAFYFMARRGSLLRYALGDPDGFYDVRAARYRDLLARLRARGCEVGLHGSFRSSELPERFADHTGSVWVVIDEVQELDHLVQDSPGRPEETAAKR